MYTPSEVPSLVRRSIQLFFIVVLISSSGQAQVIRPATKLSVNCTLARFQYTLDRSYVEVYFGFSALQISYKQTGAQFAGGVRIQYRIEDGTTRAMVQSSQFAVPVTVKDTLGQTLKRAFTFQKGFVLSPGSYILNIVGADSLDATNCDTITLPLEIQSPPQGRSMSDIELCSSVLASKDTTSYFYKNGLEVIPNPSGLYGASTYPMLFSYLELYNLFQDQVYSIKMSLIGGNKNTLKESSKIRRYQVNNAVDIGSMNVGSIPSGQYTYQIMVTDTTGHSMQLRESKVYIYNPHLRSAEQQAGTRVTSIFAAMTQAQLDEEFRRAQYLAIDQEMDLYEKISSDEGRREFLQNFWKSVEEGHAGRNSTKRSDYLARLAVANQRFTSLGREGWRTDRGRVYLLWGEPTEIIRVPFSDEAKPYENWRYDGIENGVDFYFIDRSGFGDYRLVHSTKRGELQDPNWERNLR